MSDQCRPGFEEYILGSSAEKAPLRFFGRILAQAERDQDSVTLRYALYGTSDGQFVGEAMLADNQQSSGFTEAKSFETRERAFSWFGDEALRAELRQQLESAE